MKKLVALLAVFGLALTGCSSGGGETEENSGEKVVVEVGVESNFVSYFEDVAEMYEAENENVDIKVVEAGMFDAFESLEAQKGNAIDVLMLPNDRVGDLASKKLIAPITADISGYTETAQTASTYNGETYMVPTSTDTTLLYYNKSLVDGAPATLSELSPENFVAKWTDFYFAAGLFMDQGAYIFGDGETDTSDIGLNNEGAVAAGEIIQDLYASGTTYWESLKEEQAGYDLMTQDFKDGKIQYIVDGPWKFNEYTEAMGEENVGVAPIPTWNEGSTYAPLAGTKGMGVNAYSPEKEEAIAFVNYLASEELATKFYEDTKEVSPWAGIEYPEGSLQLAVFDAAAVATSMPTDPAFGKVWEPMADALKQIANGEDVQAALDAAADTIAIEIAALEG